MLALPFVPRLGPLALHPHVVFETLGYFLGFRLYLSERRRLGDSLGEEPRLVVITAAAAGALLGSKILHALFDVQKTIENFGHPIQLMGGKTVVGGLLGGWLAVEGAKVLMKI